MRIEGTYTFPATIDRVFAALVDADTLARAIPNCERLIQLGPPAADGSATFEARIRATGGYLTLTVRVISVRRPEQIRLELRGHGPFGPLTGQGTLDLVAQERHTVSAYAWSIQAPQAPEESQRDLSAVAQRFARQTCEQLAERLRPLEPSPETLPAPGREHIVQVETPRGKIVAVPASLARVPRRLSTGEWAERAAWMGAGMVIGMSVLGLTFAIARWFLVRGEA
jgi:carbon monoxide dehydrogenase subunit G